MAGSVVAQGQRGTRQACANVAATEQQIESLAEAVDFLVDLIFSGRGSWQRRFAEGRTVSVPLRRVNFAA
jgi:predicted HAD superfamily Cof-like phosphohydrolase